MNEELDKKIQDVLDREDDSEKKYIEETTYEQQNVDINQNFSDGSIKITPELGAKAKTAVETRINSVSKYTSDRIDNINKAWKLYYSDKSQATSAKSQAQKFLPETFNACEDWSDDLYLIFNDLVSQLELSDTGDNVETYITRILDIVEQEEAKKTGILRSLVNRVVGKENIDSEETYFFKRKDIIKSLMQRGVDNSGFEQGLEDFILNGIVSGMFVFKDRWGARSDKQLITKSNGKGNIVLEPDQEHAYKFEPIDPRQLIFPKNRMSWVVQKINTTYHALLELVLDENNKPIEGAPYDFESVKKLGDHLKEKGASSIKQSEPDSFEETEDDDTDVEKLWDIDGDITVYEAHCISMVLGEGKEKRVYKSLLSFVNLSNKGNSDDAEPEKEIDLFPIGIQKTPYVAGNPYNFTNFIKKDSDIAGIGLPLLVLELQTLLNDFTSHSIDIMNLALWGIMVIDPDVLRDETKLKNISPRMMLKLKNMKGRKAADVINWLHPPLETLNQMERLLVLYQSALRRTTRRGPSGEKITPNPSATEASSIISEMQKSVNKTGIRLNLLFTTMLERMYVYNILNRKDNFKLKLKGAKLRDRKKEKTLMDEEILRLAGDVEVVDKVLELTPEEYFIDGLNFKLTAVESFNKQLVEKQQAMQVFSLLYSTGIIKNPDGTNHIMTDDAGNPVFISEYKISKQMFDYFNIENVYEKVDNVGNVSQANVQPEAGPAPTIPTTPTTPTTPNLSASPETSDILNQAPRG